MPLSLITQLLPLPLAGLLAWTGSAKVPRRRAARQAAGSAIERMLHSPAAAERALRTAGAVEIALAAALLVPPLSSAAALGTAALGACFTGYLTYAKAVMDDASCGCASTRHVPITWRSFARAGVVAVAGAVCALARASWWSAATHRPAAAVAVIAAAAVVFCALSPELDQLWLLRLRRARLRLFGHPLASASGEVPVAATVELLERSLAWQATASIVRSALLDHWDSDGWRILRYSGVQDGPGGPRAVSVVFALDATATTETITDPAIRVSVVDNESEQTLPVRVPGEPRRRPLLTT